MLKLNTIWDTDIARNYLCTLNFLTSIKNNIKKQYVANRAKRLCKTQIRMREKSLMIGKTAATCLTSFVNAPINDR